MPPFQQLFGSMEFWSALILALIGGGGLGGLVGAWSSRRKNEADIDSITADAADKAVKILTESIISPLREQVTYQEEQIRHLEDVQRKYFKAVAYVRSLSPLAAIILRGRRTGVSETSSETIIAGRASPGRSPRNNRIQ